MVRVVSFLSFLLSVFVCAVVEGFKLTSQRVKISGGVQSLSASIAAIDSCGQFNFDSCFLLSAAAAEKGADYTYGAVAAPSWALPLGAVLVILTAAIPILLKPGEAALEQQRENEKATNSEFNKRKGKGLR